MSDTLDKTAAAKDDEDDVQEKPAPLPKRKKGSTSKKKDDNEGGNSSNGQTQVEKQALEAAESAKKAAEKSREEQIEEARRDLEALDPQSEPKRWVVGKPPEMGGKENEFSIYVQDKLPWMQEKVFFSHVGRTFADAIKATGGDFGGMADVFGDEGGSIIERGRRLTQRDFGDAASFLTLAFELVYYSPMFLVDCYIIILDVPRDERRWARARFMEKWDPAANKWGLKDEEHEEIIQTFIDQNYESIRRFFAEVLPGIFRRVVLHERATDRQKDPKDLESSSAQ